MIDNALWQARFTEYLVLRGRSPRTVETYVTNLVAFLDFVQGCALTSWSELSRDHLEEYRLHLYQRRFRGRALAASTQSGHLSAVKSFVRFLVKHQYLRFDVGADVERPIVPRTLPRLVLTEQETRQLLEGVDLGSALGVRDRTILELLYSTALRNAELLALTLTDVDASRRLVRVARGKGGKSRMVPYGEEAAAWLGEYLARVRPVLCREATQQRLFLTSRGGPLKKHNVLRIVKEQARAAGLQKPLTPHGLRHSCATHMLRRGAGLRQLQGLLGHETLTSTQRYTQVEVSDLRQALMRYHPRERARP